MKTIQTKVPEQIYEKALDLVKQGWFRDEQDIFYEAIRRYLDSHRPDLMEQFIRDDVEWGLHGDDNVRLSNEIQLKVRENGGKAVFNNA